MNNRGEVKTYGEIFHSRLVEGIIGLCLLGRKTISMEDDIPWQTFFKGISFPLFNFIREKVEKIEMKMEDKGCLWGGKKMRVYSVEKRHIPSF